MCTWLIWGWIEVECKRVLLGKTFLGALVALLVINCFFFLYQQADSEGNFRTYPNAYHQAVEELAPLSWEEGLARTVAFQEEVSEAVRQDPYWFDVPENQKRYTAMCQLQTQFEYLLSYDDYVNRVQTEAKKLQQVSLFAKPETFGYQNTVKTADDFSQMLGAEVTFGHDEAVSAIFADRWTDYASLLLMVVVCGLFLAERKEGLWAMIHAASGGRKKLAWKRIELLLAAAWIGTLLLYGGKIFLSGWLYHGLGEWDRLLQSVPQFYNVPYRMTIGQFWIFYLGVKAMGNFLVGLILWTVLSAVSNLGLAFCAAGVIVGVEYACTLIPCGSAFAVFRFCNLLSYLDFLPVFTTYLNLSVFGMLISGSDLVLVMLLPLCVVFMGLLLLLAEKKRPVTRENRLLSLGDRLAKKTDAHLCGGSLLACEGKKLFLRRKGALLLAVLFLLMLYKQPPERKYDPLNMYYQYYQEKYAGPITEETLENLQKDMDNARDSKQLSALEILLWKTQMAPEGSWMVPMAPYEAIWSNNYLNYHRSTALVALLFLTLLLSNLASQERQYNMDTLLHSTPGGRRKLWRRKQWILLLGTVLVWAMVYGTELLLTVRYHGKFMCMDAPLTSLEHMRFLGWTTTIGQTLVLYYGAKLLMLLAAGETCFYLSGKCAKNSDAILLCSGVLLVPAALATIGSSVGASLSFLLPLGGVELFTKPALLLLPLAVGAIMTIGTERAYA